MDNQLRRTLLIVACCLGALVVGWQLAEGNAFLIILGLLFGIFALIQKAHKVHPEAIVFAILFIGYIVGNRGFAQLNIGGVFIGECAMLILIALGIMYTGATKKIPYQIDLIGVAILTFIAIGAIRLPIDFPRFGFNALRDYATCYYAGFYFLIQPALKDNRSSQLIEKALLVAFTLLVPFYILFDRFPDYFLTHFLINGVPVVYYKYDLLASFLGCGFFLFYFKLNQKNKFPYAILAGINFLLMLITTSRAAIPGFLAGFAFYFLAGFKNLPRFLISSVILASIPFAYFLLSTDENLEDSKAYAIIEHAISIVDINNSYHYKNAEASNSGSNNRYRMEWWKNVIKETLRDGPLMGLGFGYDLTAGFLEDYYGDSEMDFTVRSPHSIFLTVFGRMGVVGISIFLIVLGLIAKSTWNTLIECRKENRMLPSLPYYAIVWMILGSAAFGVVLEGPMGAIVFWSALGIARNSHSVTSPPKAE